MSWRDEPTQVLQDIGLDRTSGRQAQTLQTYRTPMREDGAELRLVRRARFRLHLDQNRPHGLVVRFQRMIPINAFDLRTFDPPAAHTSDCVSPLD